MGSGRFTAREASEILAPGDRVAGVRFHARDTEPCDAVVVATGYGTGLRGAGLGGSAIWTVQGYSLTARAKPDAMRVSVTDPKRRLVFARLGETVRVAGIADIGPREFAFDQSRFDTFRAAARSCFPGAYDAADAEGWSDARPCAPDSRPLIGRGKVRGLYLNLGHGACGWTLCLGAADRGGAHHRRRHRLSTRADCATILIAAKGYAAAARMIWCP
ncbi:FAD-dependent oxidoreductase [Thauera sp. SDU_THAU2]|uniref:FAD-dependent oxidoreductase n=1 Tax=Thauera sp. SDU_THAU2 TaxID=3136633 RepID=UPI00311D8507